jgi:4-alpha-glucanotransferase
MDGKLDLSPYLDEICYQLFLQDLLIKQWEAIKAKANRLGIKIIGDLPFYVGYDSVDCYTIRNTFISIIKIFRPSSPASAPTTSPRRGKDGAIPSITSPVKAKNYEFLIRRILDCGKSMI